MKEETILLCKQGNEIFASSWIACDANDDGASSFGKGLFRQIFNVCQRLGVQNYQVEDSDLTDIWGRKGLEIKSTKKAGPSLFDNRE